MFSVSFELHCTSCGSFSRSAPPFASVLLLVIFVVFHSCLCFLIVCVHLSPPSAPHCCCWAGCFDSSQLIHNPSDPLPPTLSFCSHVGSRIQSAWLTDSWTCGRERGRDTEWDNTYVCVREREKIKKWKRGMREVEISVEGYCYAMAHGCCLGSASVLFSSLFDVCLTFWKLFLWLQKKN